MSTEFNGITASVKFVRDDTEYGDGGDGHPYEWDHRVWSVTLRTEGRRMQTRYMTGTGYKGEPTAETVLGSLLSDAGTVDYSVDFEDWAANLGYDTDSRKAERDYRATVRQTNRLKRFLSDRYDEFLNLEF